MDDYERARMVEPDWKGGIEPLQREIAALRGRIELLERRFDPRPFALTIADVIRQNRYGVLRGTLDHGEQ
jgi:hypothetical protein